MTNTMRDRFEFYARNHYGRPHFEKDELGNYDSMPVDQMWRTWQAAHADMLPVLKRVREVLKYTVDVFKDVPREATCGPDSPPEPVTQEDSDMFYTLYLAQQALTELEAIMKGEK